MLRFFPAVLCVAIAQAWGPLVHFATNCAGIGVGSSVEDCVCGGSNYDLGIGSDAPDAFYFGSFTIGSECNGFSYMHDAYFAANMVKFAEANSGKYASFNALRFAQGMVTTILSCNRCIFAVSYYTVHNDPFVLIIWCLPPCM
jgi:hypothetical protein